MLPTHRPIISPILVGRRREVDLLEEVLRSVQQGVGQVVLLAGEAGIGKSRLTAEIRQQAKRGQWTVLAGHCFEHDLVFPYAPLLDMLRAFVGAQPAVSLTDLIGLQASELVKLLPELALTIPNLQPTAALDPEAEKRRLFEAILQFVVRLTQPPHPAPLLLILEDLHWSDETSLDFLHLLARRIVPFPILLLATYRGEEASPALRHFLVQVSRAHLAREVVLEALTRDDAEQLIQTIFELQRPVRSEFLEPIYTLTEGNPYFIEEVLKLLVANGEVFYADDGWTRKSMQELHIPPSVQDAVQRHTQQLEPEARRILTLAAVMGRRFDFTRLQQVAGVDESALLALIKILINAQLLVEENADSFAFRHALTRQAVYRGLLGRERQALHRAIGVAFEQGNAEKDDSSPISGAAAQVAELAYHFYEAGEWAKALDYGWRAGEKAQSLYAPRAAVEHFTRALTSAQHLAAQHLAAQHLAQQPALISCFRLRGLAYETVGDFEQACNDLATALELARSATDHDGEWRLLLDLGQLWASRNYAQTGDYFQQALTLARTLDDPAALARSLNRLGNWYLNVEKRIDALCCHHEALTIFQALNDVPGLAQTFDLLGLMVYLGGDPVQGAAELHQAIALFEQLNDRQSLASSLTTLILCGPGYSTDSAVPASMSLADFRRWHAQAIQITEEIGWLAGKAYALIAAGNFLGTIGHYGEAFTQVQRGLSVAQEIEHRQWICFAQRTLGILYRDLLDFPAARRHLAASVTLANEIGALFHVRQGTVYLSLLLIAEREFTQAQALLDGAFSLELPLEPLAQRRVWSARAELALGQGKPEKALQIIDRLLAAVANLGNGEGNTIPYLCRLQGEGLVACRQWTDAENVLQRALATAQAQNTRRLVWQIQVALGRLYQAQRQSDAATTAFSAARAMMEEIAANISDVQMGENFLRQATALLPRSRSRSPLQSAKAAYAGLTSREREVAFHIAQGKSNRAIAETLILGERTVEGYVANIMAKLGFSTRTQIAAWAVKSGLAQDDKLTG